MKKVMMLVVTGFLLNAASVWAEEEEDYTVVLPDAAQKCVLPAAPDAIPPEANLDQMMEAKKHVAEFQGMLGTYRECLKAAEDESTLTAGNKQALVASYNYSVDMEERVAERFNEAVCHYNKGTWVVESGKGSCKKD